MLAGTCEKGLLAMRADAAHAYQLEPKDSPLRSLCCLFEGVARQLIGDVSTRVQCSRKVRAVAPRRRRQSRRLALAQLALPALDDGDMEAAEAAAGRALAQGRALRDRWLSHRGRGVRRVGTRSRDAWGGSRTQATIFAGRKRLLTKLTDFIPWYEAEVRVTLARAALRLSDVPTARALLAEASPFLRRVSDAAVLQR